MAVKDHPTQTRFGHMQNTSAYAGRLVRSALGLASLVRNPYLWYRRAVRACTGLQLLRMIYLQWIPTVALLGAVLLVSAGRLDIWPIWEYIGLFAIGSFVSSFFIDPDLVKERLRPGGKRPPFSLLLVSLGFAAHWCLAGLDVGRYHWSDTVPREMQLGALAALAFSFALVTWAMHMNPFFSSVVRIQADRGQRLIREGPYRFVRHPGYSAGLIICLSSGLALGSWIAGLSGYGFIVFLVERTVREDKLLRRELPGYEEYMKEVRYRVVPGIW